MENRKPIIFRADGNERIGLGHVVRSLALAAMVKDQFEVVFAIVSPSKSIEKKILETCDRIIVLKESLDQIQEISQIASAVPQASMYVLDGYQYDTTYQSYIKKSGAAIICIDDIHAYHFVADAVVNHAPGVKADQYSCEPETELCLGLKYALLRKPFLEAARETREIKAIKNAFICLGGSDPHNLTLPCVQSITQTKAQLESIHIVLGSSNQHIAAIQSYANHQQDTAIHIHQDLNAHQMCSLMRENDLAIVSASSLLLEVISVKMPVICGYYVDNQKNIYDGFGQLHLINGIGDMNSFTGYGDLISKIRKTDIQSTIDLQSEYIDGSSHSEIIQLFNRIYNKTVPVNQ